MKSVKDKCLLALAIVLSPIAANATVIIENLSTSSSNISFDVVGTITTLGAGFNHQFGFGHVSDPSLDWITSFDAVSSSVTVSAPTKQEIYDIYDLTGIYGETIWTVSVANWLIGDEIDLHYNLIGTFNLANFDVSGLGFQAGFTTGPAIEGINNLVSSVISVPEPVTTSLLGIGLLGFGFTRLRRRI